MPIQKHGRPLREFTGYLVDQTLTASEDDQPIFGENFLELAETDRGGRSLAPTNSWITVEKIARNEEAFSLKRMCKLIE